MIIKTNNQEMTPKDFSRYVICKVTEDLEKNFDKYATAIEPNYANLTELEKAKFNEWKHKVFTHLNNYLHKEDFKHE